MPRFLISISVSFFLFLDHSNYLLYAGGSNDCNIFRNSICCIYLALVLSIVILYDQYLSFQLIKGVNYAPWVLCPLLISQQALLNLAHKAILGSLQ